MISIGIDWTGNGKAIVRAGVPCSCGCGKTLDTFDPNEPRDPKGAATGGQWTASASASSQKKLKELKDILLKPMSRELLEEDQDNDPYQIVEPEEANARPTGFPVGGWYATDPYGNVLKHPLAKYGDLPPRFETEEKALEWGNKQLRRRAKLALTKDHMLFLSKIHNVF